MSDNLQFIISKELNLLEKSVAATIKLLDDGATIPFISRYRKERTGGLDEVAVAEIKHWNDVFAEMEKRKETILETISQAGALTADLRKKIEDCVEARELEDLYLPYRPKRRTRAVVAKEAGLEPLADKMYNVSLVDPVPEARKFVGDKVASVDEALAGARDIIAERLSETASVRETLRQIFKTRRIVTKATKKATGPEAMKYKSYFDYSESLDRIAPHRLLAILRAEEEGILSLKIDADAEKCGKKLITYIDDLNPQVTFPDGYTVDQVFACNLRNIEYTISQTAEYAETISHINEAKGFLR